MNHGSDFLNNTVQKRKKCFPKVVAGSKMILHKTMAYTIKTFCVARPNTRSSLKNFKPSRNQSKIWDSKAGMTRRSTHYNKKLH